MDIKIKLTLPKKSYDRLLALQKTMEAPDILPVIGNAIRFFEAVVDMYNNGKKLYTKNSEGGCVEWDIFEKEENSTNNECIPNSTQISNKMGSV